MPTFEELANELFEIMDPAKHRPPHEPMNKMMRGEMAVMRLLDRGEDEMTAGEISRALRMSSSRMAAVLNSLERKNQIQRCEDPQDRRRVLVRITAGGRDFCRSRREEIRERMRRMLTRMGEADAAEYVRLTRRAFELAHCEEACDDACDETCGETCGKACLITEGRKE